jgi:hypothetical protein
MPTSWGPSLLDIATAHTNQKHGFLAGADEPDLSDDDDSLSSDRSECSGEDAEFMDLVEDLAMLDVEQRDVLTEVRSGVDAYIGRKRHRLD